MQFGVNDLLSECFRVSEGKIHYIFDTWMKNTYEIIS
jgi:hypothetical protein